MSTLASVQLVQALHCCLAPSKFTNFMKNLFCIFHFWAYARYYAVVAQTRQQYKGQEGCQHVQICLLTMLDVYHIPIVSPFLFIPSLYATF